MFDEIKGIQVSIRMSTITTLILLKAITLMATWKYDESIVPVI